MQTIGFRGVAAACVAGFALLFSSSQAVVAEPEPTDYSGRYQGEPMRYSYGFYDNSTHSYYSKSATKPFYKEKTYGFEMEVTLANREDDNPTVIVSVPSGLGEVQLEGFAGDRRFMAWHVEPTAGGAYAFYHVDGTVKWGRQGALSRWPKIRGTLRVYRDINGNALGNLSYDEYRLKLVRKWD